MKIFSKLWLVMFLIGLICITTGCKEKIKINVEETNITIKVNEEYAFVPVLENVTNPNYSFSLSDASVIKIVNRKFIGVKPGICEVTIGLANYPDVEKVTIIVEVIE